MKRLSCNQMGRDNLTGPANLILPSVEAVDPQIIDLLRRRHRASTVTCSVKRDTSESPIDMPPEPWRAPLNPNMAIITMRGGREQDEAQSGYILITSSLYILVKGRFHFRCARNLPENGLPCCRKIVYNVDIKSRGGSGRKGLRFSQGAEVQWLCGPKRGWRKLCALAWFALLGMNGALFSERAFSSSGQPSSASASTLIALNNNVSGFCFLIASILVSS